MGEGERCEYCGDEFPVCLAGHIRIDTGTGSWGSQRTLCRHCAHRLIDAMQDADFRGKLAVVLRETGFPPVQLTTTGTKENEMLHCGICGEVLLARGDSRLTIETEEAGGLIRVVPICRYCADILIPKMAEGGFASAIAGLLRLDVHDDPAAEEARCGNCRFWLTGYRLSEGMGECRRGTPLINMTYNRGHWPCTHKVDWCGEHKTTQGEG